MELSPARQRYLEERTRAAANVIPDSLEMMKAAYSRGMALVWEQESDIGPAEILTELGTRAAALFSEGAWLLSAIVEREPGWLEFAPMPTHAFTINPDGSVELGAKIEPTQEPLEQE